jgi:two-component system, LytTR family, response regulator
MKKEFEFSVEEMQQQIPEVFCKLKNIDWNNVLYCKADGSYTWIILENNMRVKHAERLGLVCKILPIEYFNRCHNKFAVNLDKISRIRTSKHPGVLFRDNIFIPISRRKKNDLEKLFEKYPVLK